MIQVFIAAYVEAAKHEPLVTDSSDGMSLGHRDVFDKEVNRAGAGRRAKALPGWTGNSGTRDRAGRSRRLLLCIADLPHRRSFALVHHILVLSRDNIYAAACWRGLGAALPPVLRRLYLAPN